MKNKNIIITGIQPWDIEIGSNCKNIAIEFSKQNNVLYINAPLDRNTLKTKRNDPQIERRIRIMNGEESCFEKINDTLTVFYPRILQESINKIPYLWLFSLLNKRNNKKFAKEIIYAASEMGMKDFIHFNDSDMFRSFYLKELLNPLLSIYYIRDNLVKVPYWKKHGQYIEPMLIAKSDVVVTNSDYYADYARKYNPKSEMVGQGCDFSIYDESSQSIETAEDIKSLSHPIIGYVGYIAAMRLNINLILKIASERPDWTIVLVGPEDEAFKKSSLHNVNNIIFTGSRKMEDLPSYIKGFDVCINPQILNDTTVGNYPRKIDEYLAMGKPVVATKTEAMRYFSEYTYLAENEQDYLKLINEALISDSPELHLKRAKFAKQHTWENNVNEIYKQVENFQTNKL